MGSPLSASPLWPPLVLALAGVTHGVTFTVHSWPPVAVVAFGGSVTLNCSHTPCPGDKATLAIVTSLVATPGPGGPLWQSFWLPNVSQWQPEPVTCWGHCGDIEATASSAIIVYKLPRLVALDPVPALPVGHSHPLTCHVLEVAPLGNLTVTLRRGAETLRTATFGDSPGGASVAVSHVITVARGDHGQAVTCHAELSLRPHGPLFARGAAPVQLSVFDLPEPPQLEAPPILEVATLANATCRVAGAFPAGDTRVTLALGRRRLNVTAALVAPEDAVTARAELVAPPRPGQHELSCTAQVATVAKTARRKIHVYRFPELALEMSPATVAAGKEVTVTCQAGDSSEPHGDTRKTPGDIPKPTGDIPKPPGDILELPGATSGPLRDTPETLGDSPKPPRVTLGPSRATPKPPGDILGPLGDIRKSPGDAPKPPRGTLGPPGATSEPLGDTQKPHGDTLGPPGATLETPGDTLKLPGDTSGPPGDTLGPLGATRKPRRATSKPRRATPKPPGATLGPLGATSEPHGTTPKPSGDTPESPRATPKPPEATSEPPGATSEPPGATSEPPGATSEPPGDTSEPPGDTQVPPSATPLRLQLLDGRGRVLAEGSGPRLQLRLVARRGDNGGPVLCRASLDVGGTEVTKEVTTRLRVLYPPEFPPRSCPAHRAWLRGALEALSCLATGNPSPTVVCGHRGATVATNESWLVTESRAGTYECKATNALGTRRRRVTVRVEREPTMSESGCPARQVRVEGQRWHLECDADGDPAPSMRCDREGGTQDGGIHGDVQDGGTQDGGIHGGDTQNGTHGGTQDGGTHDGTQHGGIQDGGTHDGTQHGGIQDGGTHDGTQHGGIQDGGTHGGTRHGGIQDGGTQDGGIRGGTQDGGIHVGDTQNGTHGVTQDGGTHGGGMQDGDIHQGDTHGHGTHGSTQHGGTQDGTTLDTQPGGTQGGGTHSDTQDGHTQNGSTHGHIQDGSTAHRDTQNGGTHGHTQDGGTAHRDTQNGGTHGHTQDGHTQDGGTAHRDTQDGGGHHGGATPGLGGRVVTRADGGRYVCRATNRHGVATRSVLLTVEFPPRLPQLGCPARHRWLEGSPARLSCAATGNPPPSVTCAYRDNRASREITQLSRELQVATATLEVANVSRGHAGTVECRASNEHGWASRNVSVEVEAAPWSVSVRVVPAPPIRRGADFSVSCSARGLPRPRLSWALPAAPNVRRAGDNGSVVATAAAAANAGTYTCVASNAHGRRAASVEVTLHGQRWAPVLVPLVLLGAGSALGALGALGCFLKSRAGKKGEYNVREAEGICIQLQN